MKRRGFTLIEMLIVIAIIAILMAILLPVFATARERARRATCEGNLHDIYQALQMFRKDTLGFPPGLWDTSSTTQTAILDSSQMANYHVLGGAPATTKPEGLWILLGVADQSNNVVVPQYLTSDDSLHCPDNPQTNPAVQSTQTTVGYDNYDGPDLFALSQGMDLLRAVQTYGLSRFAPGTNAGDPDYSRQLSLKDPDDTTVITWCIEHRPWAGAIPTPSSTGRDDIFLYLDGRTRVGGFDYPSNPGACPGHPSYANGFDDIKCP
jgi:prepilin-type N-terminal cleavage/methylation domain-containing protein